MYINILTPMHISNITHNYATIYSLVPNAEAGFGLKVPRWRRYKLWQNLGSRRVWKELSWKILSENSKLWREKREKNRENMREREGSRARKTENMASRYHITACGCKLAKPQTNMSWNTNVYKNNNCWNVQYTPQLVSQSMTSCDRGRTFLACLAFQT